MDINNSQNATYTILDLPKIIKIAREHTLLGRYETSLKKYQIALEIIQARKKEVNVGVIHDKWQMTELNIKSEINQTKQMLEACKNLTNIDFNYFKKQFESNEIKKKKLQEKGVMVFDMSSNHRSSGPNQNYFGSAPFSYKDQNKENPFSDFQKDPINGIMTDSINSEVNEDDEKILNPLIPQKKFGTKNKNRKKQGKITAINVIKNNNNNKNTGEKKSNPWFQNDKSKSDNINTKSNKLDELSILNPLEQFDLTKTDAGIDASMSINNTTMDNNTTFMKEIKSFIDKNNKNSYVENAKKRKSMGMGLNSKNNLNNNNPKYPIGVGNYSNKNKMINFDLKTANKGALPVIMKNQNQKIINNKQEKNDKKDLDFDNKTNNNDISGVNMIDEALKNFNNLGDDSSILDMSKVSKWMK